MCMATLIPSGVDIPFEGLENGAVVNDDGHGYAIASSRLGMETFKSMNYETTMNNLTSARARHGKSSVVLFHSRFGTHGELSNFNVHPFEVAPGTVMAHNGIMPSSYHPLAKDRRSDTRIFVDRVAAEFCDNRKGVPSLRGGKQLAAMVGSYNKLVFLSVKSGTPAVRIVNADLGVSEGGVWYSNSGFHWGYSRTPSAPAGGVAGGAWWDEDWYVKMRERAGLSTNQPAECPMCLSLEIDAAANICLDCDFCLDCNEYLVSCLCYLPGGWDKVEDYDDEDDEVLNIEDAADDGYVKVNGVWVWANSLIDQRKKSA